jgi:hypothetical protein
LPKITIKYYKDKNDQIKKILNETKEKLEKVLDEVDKK